MLEFLVKVKIYLFKSKNNIETFKELFKISQFYFAIPNTNAKTENTFSNQCSVDKREKFFVDTFSGRDPWGKIQFYTNSSCKNLMHFFSLKGLKENFK